jgi:hypothetical protein
LGRDAGLVGYSSLESKTKAFVAFIELHPEKQKESPLVVAAEALIALDYAPPPTLVAARTWERCGRKKTP